MLCRNPHLETEGLNSAAAELLGILNAGFGTHLLGRLVLTLTRATWQFLALKLGMPAESCRSRLLAVRFAASAISMLPPMKLLGTKLGHHRTSPRQRASPPQPPSSSSLQAPAPLTFSQ